MSARRKHPLSLKQLGECYGCTRQHLHQLAGREGFDALLDPDELFEALIETGRLSHLRTKLADPDFRMAVRNRMASAVRIDVLMVEVSALRKTLRTRKS